MAIARSRSAAPPGTPAAWGAARHPRRGDELGSLRAVEARVPDIPGATRARGGVAARLGAIVGMQAIQVSQSALMAVSLRSRRLGPNTTASVSQSALVAVSLRSLSVLRGSASSSLNPRSRRCRCAAQLAARRYAGSHVSIRARGVAAQRPWESWLCRSMRLNPRSWRCRCAATSSSAIIRIPAVSIRARGGVAAQHTGSDLAIVALVSIRARGGVAAQPSR